MLFSQLIILKSYKTIRKAYCYIEMAESVNTINVLYMAVIMYCAWLL